MVGPFSKTRVVLREHVGWKEGSDRDGALLYFWDSFASPFAGFAPARRSFQNSTRMRPMIAQPMVA